MAAALPPSPGIVHSAWVCTFCCFHFPCDALVVLATNAFYYFALKLINCRCGNCCILGTGFRLLCLLRTVRGGKAFSDCGHGYLRSLGEVPVLFERLNSQLRTNLAL